MFQQKPSGAPALRLTHVLLIGIVLFVALEVAHWLVSSWLRQQAEPRPVAARGDLAADEKSTINIFTQASPSVVFISTSKRVRNFWTRNTFSVPSGTGSGFIWDESGHVVTNHHVIEGASEASIRLNDGRSYNASLVGISPRHDLAVLRINVEFDQPPPVPVGSSFDLQVGQKVFAIGNPFGLDYTLTSGIVSALNRSLTVSDDYTIDNLVQTDAAINPGNSGGPLLDSAGRLIGINTAIFSPSGASAGIGFAVPVDTVNQVVPQLIAHGRYLQPSIGIAIDAALNDKILSQLDIQGVVVLSVAPGSTAERVGLQGTVINRFGNIIPGDVIQAIDNIAIKDVPSYYSALDKFKVGDQVRLTLWRQGRLATVDVQLEGK